ncbi:MAG TPA: hypothetical protein VLZ75_08490, partial [Chitinophagales bacterium]|nr:hypothetical protein [Chitinophagales bacterium]
MIKNLHNYKSFFKKSIFFIAQFIFFQLLFVSNASAQSYNDGGIRVKVWVHAVYADANCEERTPIPFIDGSGRNQKYVFKDIQVRGQHSGTSFRSSNPVTFNVTGRNNRFWKADAFRFYDILGGGSSNLLTPPEVPWGNLPILAKLFQPQLNTAIDNTRGLLIFDETFSNESAPSVIQWRMDDAWENDCNLPGNNNYKDSPDPICNENFISLPSYLYSGECVCRFTLIPKICIFGICTPEIKLPWIEGLTPLYGPRGDDHRQRKNDFSTDAIPFRSGSPGVVNYFMSEKMGTGGDGGYAVVFAYQWEFINEPSVCNSNANGNVSFAANPLGGNKIDGPIDLYVSFDRIFSASDFDGGSNCFGLPNVFGLIPIFAGDENLRVRWAARDNLDPAIGATTNVFGHIGDPNGELTQNRPRWNSRNVPMLEKHYCDYPNTCLDGNINMSGFQVKVDAWEEDGCGPDETFSTSNCLLGSLFSGGVDGDDNFSTYTSPVVNWRLSPPNTDNYYYLPINVSNSSLEGWFARVKYRWEIQDPVAHLLDTTEIINKCYNVGGPIVINSTTTNATYMQWEYSNWSGPSGAPPDRCPPEDAVWFEATGHPGARCENLTVPANEFRGTRYYRLKVFNRNGAGSKSSSGDKYAVSYSECKRISI